MRPSRKLFPFIAFLILLAACSKPTTDVLIRQQAKNQNEFIRPPFPHSGTSVAGYEKFLGVIRNLLPEHENGNILFISLINNSYAEVHTGSAINSKHGGGKRFIFVFSNNEWQLNSAHDFNF